MFAERVSGRDVTLKVQWFFLVFMSNQVTNSTLGLGYLLALVERKCITMRSSVPTA